MLDQLDPNKVSLTRRLAPSLPPFYEDITRVPEIANALSKGLVESATLGTIKLPEVKDETVPMRIARIGGGVLGAVIFQKGLGLIGPAGETLSAAGAARALIGTGVAAGAGVAKRYLHPDEEALLATDIFNAGMLGVMNAMFGPAQAKEIAERIVLKMPLQEALRAGQAVRRGALKALPKSTLNPKYFKESGERYSGMMGLYQRAISEEEAELSKTFQTIIKNVPKGEVDFRQLQELGKRAARGEALPHDITIDHDYSPLYELARDLPAGYRVLREPKYKGAIGETFAGEPTAAQVPTGKPDLRAVPDSPVQSMRKINAELDRRFGVAQTVETRGTSSVGGGASRPLQGTITLPDGKVITEAEALARRGRPARAPVEPGDVRADLGAASMTSSRIIYTSKVTGEKAGSTTYVKLKPDIKGGKYYDAISTPQGVEMHSRYVPIEVGDEAEYMITEFKPAQGFSDFMIRDLRGRGIRFLKADRKTIHGMAKRLGATRVGETDIYEFVNPKTVRGGLGEETSKATHIWKHERTRVSMLGAYRPMKYVLQDIERVDNLPYSSMFDAVETAKETAKEEAFRLGDRAFGIIRGWRKAKRIGGMDAYAGTTSKLLDPNDLAKLDEVKHEVLNPLLGQWFGRDFDDFMKRVVIPARTQARFEVPKEYERIIPIVDGVRLNLRERDLAKFINQLVHVGTFDIHAGPTLSEAGKFVSKGFIPADVRNMLHNYIRGADGTERMFNDRILAPLYQGFWRVLGQHVSKYEARNVVSTINALTHAGLLGFRPAPVIRNLLGGILTGAPRIGPRWYLEGQRQSFTPEGFRLFKESGIPEEAASIIDRLDEMSMGVPGRLLSKTSRFGMWPYAKVDLVPRAAAYLGGRARLLNAAKRLGTNAPEEAIFDKTGLWNFHPTLRKEIVGLWRQSKFTEAANLFGMHAQQDTQWVYRTGFRPEMLRNEIGRLLGAFGVWPLNYIEYFRQMMLPPSLGGLPETPYAKKLVHWIGPWIATNAAVLGAFGAAGAHFGMGPAALKDTARWTFFGPMFYGGGPFFEAFPAAAHFMSEVMSGSPMGPRAQQELRKLMSFIPGAVLKRDLERSMGKTITVEQEGKLPYERIITEEPRDALEFLFRLGTGIQRKPTP